MKNPVSPDLELWIGGVERIYNASSSPRVSFLRVVLSVFIVFLLVYYKFSTKILDVQINLLKN